METEAEVIEARDFQAIYSGSTSLRKVVATIAPVHEQTKALLEPLQAASAAGG